MAAKLDFRSVWVNLQADNASKEVKNVGILRLMAMWTGLHKIAGAEISFLSSGHSHEDVDALFSLLRAHLEKTENCGPPMTSRPALSLFSNALETVPMSHSGMLKCFLSTRTGFSFDFMSTKTFETTRMIINRP